MWKEILGGAGLLGVLVFMLSIQNRRIDKKMSADVCIQRCKSTDTSFKTIQTQQKYCQAQFKDLFDKLNEQGGTLIEVKTILSIAAKKNGWDK